MPLKRKNILLIIIFSAIITLPLFDNIFNFSPIKNLFEKRESAIFPQRPKNFSDIKDYTKKLEIFFNDNYGFRKSLIFANSKIMDDIFGESPSSRAFIGKDEWLYFDNQNSLLDAQGLAKINDEKLVIAAKSFVNNWQILQKNNIDYLLVIAADKTSIYPEFLPDFIKTSSKNRRIDKFILAIKKENSNFPILDLRPILKEAKRNEIIYQKTDTHWNKRGAHFAYVEIMKILAQKNQSLKYHERSDFSDTQNEMLKGDISDIMNINAQNIDYSLKEKFPKNFHQKNASNQEKKLFHRPIFFINNDKNLPVLFVYKDSFFDNMLEFFATHFSRSYFINQFPCEIDLEIVKKYHPNILVQEFWEGRVEEVVNGCK